MTLAGLLMFVALNGIFEPSAIQQLPDGRFLVVEDEKEHAFSLLTIGADATTSKTALRPDPAAPPIEFDDLEGISADSAGFVYAITSHSRSGKGKEKKERERLVRFRVEGDLAKAPVVVTRLKAALTAAHPLLAQAATVLDAKSGAGINIEALEATQDGERLLIGFRSPLQGERAIVAVVENARAVFEAGAAIRLNPQLIALDLGGDGIRGMAYVPSLAAYLVIGGPATRADGEFKLWAWRGTPHDRPRRVSVPGLANFARAEGVAAAVIDGKPKVVLVSDDGDREEGKPASFIVLDPGQLRIAP